MYIHIAPISYSLELTYQCPQKCIGCSNIWKNNKYKEMIYWKTILDSIAPPIDRKKFVQHLRITGGEPTYHKDFNSIIKYIDDFDIPFVIFTTAQWIKPKEIINLLSNTNNFAGLLVSLHGKDEISHAQQIVNGKKNFRRICKNIELAAKSGIDIFTNTILNRITTEQIDEICCLSYNIGAKCAVFNRYLGNKNKMHPTEEQLKNAVIRIDKLRESKYFCRIGNCIPPCFTDNNSDGPNAGIEHCTISPDGWIRPENLVNYTFGNIFKNHIVQIWDSIKAKTYRSYISEKCLGCNEFRRCRGGVKRIDNNGNYLRDELIAEPIISRNIKYTFNSDDIPVPLFKIQSISSRHLLNRFDRFLLPQFNTSLTNLEAIDGKSNIQYLYAQYGENVIKLLVDLYKNNFITFQKNFY